MNSNSSALRGVAVGLHDAAEEMNMKLSPAQKSAVMHARVERIAYENFQIETFDGNDIRTAKALGKKGLAKCLVHQWWLTEKGKEVREELWEDHCVSCFRETHRNEAACIHCGSLKAWAQD
ncbi:MAG: hypothetical protein V6Z86_05635 [Hyphomicrobiales bacterium]